MEASSRPARRARIRRSREQWHALLERFEHSGQSSEQFCREQGLTLSNFSRWRRVLGGTGTRQQVIAGKPRFLELTPQASAAGGVWDMELELGAGVVLRLRRPC